MASERHYSRAAWLLRDLPHNDRRMAILGLLEAASGEDAGLRRILTDPALLGAPPHSKIGKMYPDTATKFTNIPNIAKMVNTFCQEEWGCSVRSAILDDGMPAGRKFVEDPGLCALSKVPPYTCENPIEPYVYRDPAQFLAQLRVMRMTRGKSRAVQKSLRT